MKYHDAFKEKVKKAFPENKELHKALESGNTSDVGSALEGTELFVEWFGIYIDDTRPGQ
ncbi:MAG: hypothetical protein PF572_00815 [Patescibacteria group bacterium]|jgi:hypothetical protein|nr:hypothetical protein [Patescibacteria group bacterium]